MYTTSYTVFIFTPFCSQIIVWYMYIYEQINKLKFDGNHSILRENCNKQRKTTRIVPDNF